MTDSYHGLAADYDWIFDDGALAGGAAINRPAVARLLQRIRPDSAVLDAACGTGIDAAVLARRGFRVRAADGSEAMVRVAAARFRREGLAIGVQRCLWADLPAAIEERFDVVLCTGNALVHAAGRDAMVQALIGLRRMARPGGHVVIDSRNWDKLHAERRIVQVMDGVRVRAGHRCVVLYAWEVPDHLDEEHIAHLVFVFEDGDRVEPHEYRLSFRPFTLGELRERLELAGLREIDTDFGEAADRYAVIAVAALVAGGLDELAGQFGRAREHYLVAARHLDDLAAGTTRSAPRPIRRAMIRGRARTSYSSSLRVVARARGSSARGGSGGRRLEGLVRGSGGRTAGRWRRASSARLTAVSSWVSRPAAQSSGDMMTSTSGSTPWFSTPQP